MNDIADFVRQQGLLTERGNASAGGVTLMGKVRVNGEEADPIWKVRPQQPRSLMPPPPPPPRQLIVLPALPLVQLARSAFPGEVTWNFAGIFLFDAAGLCVGRFDLDGDTADVDDLLGVIVMRRRACVKGPLHNGLLWSRRQCSQVGFKADCKAGQASLQGARGAGTEREVIIRKLLVIKHFMHRCRASRSPLC